MSTYAHYATALAAILPIFAKLEEKINATLRQIAKAAKRGERSCSAKLLLELIEQSVEPYDVRKTAHS
jgi:hypothetical protein